MAGRLVAGSDFKIWVLRDDEWILIGCAEDVSVNVSAETISASCKASGSWSDSAIGQKSWTMSASGIYKIYTDLEAADNYSATNLFDNISIGDKLTMRIGTETVGDPIYSGDVYVTSWELSGGTGDGATYSADFQGSGVLTRTAVLAPAPVV